MARGGLATPPPSVGRHCLAFVPCLRTGRDACSAGAAGLSFTSWNPQCRIGLYSLARRPAVSGAHRPQVRPVLHRLAPGVLSGRPLLPGSSTAPTSRFSKVTLISTRSLLFDRKRGAPRLLVRIPHFLHRVPRHLAAATVRPRPRSSGTAAHRSDGGGERARNVARRTERLPRGAATWFYTDRVPVADFHATHAVDQVYRLVAELLGAGGPWRLVSCAAPGRSTLGRRPCCASAGRARGSPSDPARAG